MKTNEVLSNIHGAAVKKAAAQCAVEGDALRAIEISNAIIAYGQQWAESFADDGKLSDAECAKIQAAFDAMLDKYVPSLDNPAVSIAYEGMSGWFLKLFGIEWKGIRYYLNQWFGLGL